MPRGALCIYSLEANKIYADKPLRLPKTAPLLEVPLHRTDTTVAPLSQAFKVSCISQFVHVFVVPKSVGASQSKSACLLIVLSAAFPARARLFGHHDSGGRTQVRQTLYELHAVGY